MVICIRIIESEAWEVERLIPKYGMPEEALRRVYDILIHTDTDTDSEGGSQHQVQRASRKVCLRQAKTGQPKKTPTENVNGLQVIHSAAFT